MLDAVGHVPEPHLLRKNRPLCFTSTGKAFSGDKPLPKRHAAALCGRSTDCSLPSSIYNVEGSGRRAHLPASWRNELVRTQGPVYAQKSILILFVAPLRTGLLCYPTANTASPSSEPLTLTLQCFAVMRWPQNPVFQCWSAIYPTIDAFGTRSEAGLTEGSHFPAQSRQHYLIGLIESVRCRMDRST